MSENDGPEIKKQDRRLRETDSPAEADRAIGRQRVRAALPLIN